jgi:hypothetical protein
MIDSGRPLRKTSTLFVVFLAGAVLMVVLPLILMAAVPPSPQPVRACGSEPQTPNSIQVAPGQTQSVFTSYGGNERITVWSNSTVSYILFVLTGPQYIAYGNTTGTNGTIPYHPPTNYFWTSGPATATNNTFALVSGDWYLMVYNPQSSQSIVNVEVAVCFTP